MRSITYLTMVLVAGLVLFGTRPVFAISLESSNYELANPVFGQQLAITTNQDNVAPVISSDGPTVVELTSTKAVIEWKTDKASTSTVAYGTTDSYGQENGNSQLGTSHSITLNGLTPEQLYHYQVLSTDSFGSEGASTDHTFSTTAELGVTTIKISRISYDYGLVTFSTGGFTTAKVEYGTTTKYGKTKSGNSSTRSTDHTVELKDLTEGTDYHLRIVAEDEKGNQQTSSDFSFTTIAIPHFASITVSPINPNEVSLTIKTNTETSVIIHYKAIAGTGLDTASDTTAASNEYAVQHKVLIKELFGQTTYQYYLVATDQQGKQVTSPTKTFSTPTDSQAPTISDLKVVTSRSGDQLVMTATWKTDEPSKGNISYVSKTNTAKPTQVDGSVGFATNHTITSTGLSPATPYTLTAAAIDPFGNRQTADISFVSPKLDKSIFQLLIDIISSYFGWLLKIFK